ncbi:hypothetical protein IK1_00206 [Bacillus cereus VD146]|uniref:Uncharacterized protein n=1 Tax=Bacillus cereus (strain VD146) TaxID=1053236 RepID=R8N9I4_BACCX|nr:hypothetical protein IK1_00206 [Bacillus cereus VD146]
MEVEHIKPFKEVVLNFKYYGCGPLIVSKDYGKEKGETTS